MSEDEVISFDGKQLCIVISFPNSTAAIRMREISKIHKILGTLIPVPRSMKAGCGLAWASPVAYSEKLRAYISEHEIPVDGESVLSYSGVS